jgi:hypothetical protein
MGKSLKGNTAQKGKGKLHKHDGEKEKETKKDQRLKKKELKRQNRIDKDYGSVEEKAFSSSLSDLKLKIKFMEGDGNCLFRSIADQTIGCDRQHYDIRMKVVEYMEKHKNHFILFIEDDEDFGDYIDRMKTDKEWGGHQEIYAASQCLKVNIIVHQCDAARYVIHCEEAIHDINISYHGECHFNSVRGIDDDGESNAKVLTKHRKHHQAVEQSVSKARSLSNNDCYDNDDEIDIDIDGIDINGNDVNDIDIDIHDTIDESNNQRVDDSDVSDKNGNSSSSGSNTTGQNDSGNDGEVRNFGDTSNSNNDHINNCIKRIVNDNADSCDTSTLEGYLDTPAIPNGYLPHSNGHGFGPSNHESLPPSVDPPSSHGLLPHPNGEYTCICMYIYLFVYACMYVNTYECTYVSCLYVFMYVFKYMYAYEYVHIYT